MEAVNQVHYFWINNSAFDDGFLTTYESQWL